MKSLPKQILVEEVVTAKSEHFQLYPNQSKRDPELP